MRNWIFSIAITGIVLVSGVSPAFAADKPKASDEARDRLADRIDSVNRATRKSDKMKMALERISTETGIPLEEVKALHKRRPGQGAAELLLAGVLANETKKSPQKFLDEYVGGKKWPALARDANVPLERLEERLERLEKALTN